MKINSPRHFLEALQQSREICEKIALNQKLAAGKIYALVNKMEHVVGDNDEARQMLSELEDMIDNLHDQLCQSHFSGSFQDCVMRILTYEANSIINHEQYPECSPSEYCLSGDFAPYSMTFSERREDGRCGLCGGIIFHGDPETGYQENGSVSLSPSYGWQIHT